MCPQRGYGSRERREGGHEAIEERQEQMPVEDISH
jgi:hypothetical protein